jgi:aspartate-semialdehyde dehydrogenase
MAGSGKKGFNVGIVGATGAVGVEIIKCLSKREFPVQRLTLYTSARSSGKIANTEYGYITLEEYSLAAVRQCDIVFLAVSGEFALENAKLMCAEGGPIVIDNSSAFRYDADIPLVVSVPSYAYVTLL